MNQKGAYFETSCVRNECTVRKFDPSSCLPVPVEDCSEMALHQCLDMALEEEDLDEDNWMVSPQLSQPAKSTKKLDLWRVPQALIVHLKRFTEAAKVRTFVDYPDALDLSEWLVGPPPAEGCLYQLGAVVCHHGSTRRSGHYTTEALVDGTWFSFDDPRVTPLATFKPKADAYLLFYQRQHVTT